MFSKLVILALLGCWGLSTIYAATYFKITKLECAPNPKYFTNHTCRLKPIDRYTTLSFMETYIKDILRNVTVNIGLYIRNDVNSYQPYLLNISVNMCKFVDRKLSGFYVKVFLKLMSEFSNVNHTCPYTGPLIVNGGYFNTSLLPKVSFPKHAYKVLFVFYEGYPWDYIGTVAYYLEVIETRHK